MVSASALVDDPLPEAALPYASPEFYREPEAVGYATDLWSLGATLFHVATGRRPFEARSGMLWSVAVAGDMDAAAPSVLDCLDPDARSRSLPPHRPARLHSTMFSVAGTHARALLNACHARLSRRRARAASTTTWRGS